VKTKILCLRRAVRVLLLAVALACLLGHTSARADTRSDTLQAIHLVENPRDLTRPGPAGELGAYQFRSKTWAQHSTRPFRDALVRAYSDEVALAHYDWLCAGLRRNGVAVTPYNIALAWNAGLTAVVKGRVPRTARSYAERVNNLAEAMGLPVTG
jgi:hypothetical protein